MSIRFKLALMSLTVTLIPLVIVVSLLALQDVREMQRSITEQTELAANLSAQFTAATIAFNNPQEATQTLSRLEEIPELLFAVIYDSEGRLFAAYRRPDVDPDLVFPYLPPEPDTTSPFVEARSPVMHEGVEYGTIVLRSSTARLEQRRDTYLWGLLAASLVVVVVAGALALMAQTFISRPVRELAGAAQSVAQGADYSVRVTKWREDELGVLADGFNTMLQEVERRQQQAREAVRVREEFLSIAAHELRTPLTTLKLQLQQLARPSGGGPSPPSPQRERGLQMSIKQVERLAALVKNLLDVTRIEAGRLPLERGPMDLRELVADVVQRFQHSLAEAGCVVTVDAPAPVLGRWDASRLDQVVSNLLTNAIKYGAGMPIRLELSADAQVARLAVSDQGIGISEEDQARVFERFERGESERHYGGLGLGLYITRQIVRAHGGTIRVTSRKGEGSRFEVELPLGVE